MHSFYTRGILFQHMQRNSSARRSMIETTGVIKQHRLHQTCTHKHTPSHDVTHSLKPCDSSTASGLNSAAVPMYENVDDFDQHRSLAHSQCQCQFDSSSQTLPGTLSDDVSQDSKFYTSQSHPCQSQRQGQEDQGVNCCGQRDSTDGAGLPSSLQSDAVKYKDASTQHGGILHVRDSVVLYLVHANSRYFV